MKYILYFLILISTLIWGNLVGQNVSRFQNCEIEAQVVAGKLAKMFSLNGLDSIDLVNKDIFNHCGVSEWSQRSYIVYKILKGLNADNEIVSYFENDFYQYYIRRLESSQAINFGYIYNEYKFYYGYLPLRHALDSAIFKSSANLLIDRKLSKDEELMCVLFSGDIERFEATINNYDNKESKIKQYFLKRKREEGEYSIGYNLQTSVVKPFGNQKVFNYSPEIGFSSQAH